MSNPLNIMSGTNTRAILKKLLGEHQIYQFDVHKHQHVRDNMIEPYPSVGQVAGAHSSLQTGTNQLWIGY